MCKTMHQGHWQQKQMSSPPCAAGKTISDMPTSFYRTSAFYRHSLILLGSAVLSACQLTAFVPNTEEDEQHHHEQAKAAEIINACEQAGAESHDAFTCEAGMEGTIPVAHPVAAVDVPLQPQPEVIEEPVEQGPPPVTDVWQRIRNQLSFEVPDNKRVAAQRNWYLKHPDYMERVAKRARPFLHLIVERIEDQQMPIELALLPIVESAFDPFAYSHGRAAGMWQFIPGTGKRFGMKQTWWYDGRRDVVASTDGAMNYLTYLRDYFDGDWLHALAAYNSGEGRVKKAVRKNRKNGKSTDFWALDLPRETRAYVPKLLALVDILQNSEQYNFNFPAIDNAAVTALVDTGSQIDLALAAEFAGLSLEELHALNPGYNRWATDPNGPHRLLLPVEKVASFSEALAKTDDDKRLNWVRHKIRGGDSLLKLAKKYHTTVDIIQKVNDMRGNVIRAGDHLLVPVALKSLDQYALSQDQRLVATQQKKRGSYSFTHEVKSGDTLWDISRMHKVKLRSLAKWNGMAPTDPLMPGQKLVVWVNRVSEEQRDNAVMRGLTYTVRKGDSLARIAGKFKVRIADIKRWNQLNTQKYLQPGQKLKLFVDVTRT